MSYTPPGLMLKALNWLDGDDEKEAHGELLTLAIGMVGSYAYQRYRGRTLLAASIHALLLGSLYYLIFNALQEQASLDNETLETVASGGLTSLCTVVLSSLVNKGHLPKPKEKGLDVLVETSLLSAGQFFANEFDALTDWIPFTSAEEREFAFIVLLLTGFLVVEVFSFVE